MTDRVTITPEVVATQTNEEGSSFRSSTPSRGRESLRDQEEIIEEIPIKLLDFPTSQTQWKYLQGLHQPTFWTLFQL